MHPSPLSTGCIFYCAHSRGRMGTSGRGELLGIYRYRHLKSIRKLWWEADRDAFATRTGFGVLNPCMMVQSHPLVHVKRCQSPAPEGMCGFKQSLKNTFLQMSYIERITCAGVRLQTAALAYFPIFWELQRELISKLWDLPLKMAPVPSALLQNQLNASENFPLLLIQ